jgi:uncharacterized damage-inducible protein DinB
VDLLERLLAHDAWTTRELLVGCRDLAPAQFIRRFDIGPGSLHDTFEHIIGAMEFWADHIGGRPRRPSIRKDNRTWTPDELVARLAGTAADLGAVARAVVDEGRLEETMQVRDRRFTRGSAIAHVVTHGTHHRAQVLNMLRRLGVKELIEGDVITWELARREG